MPKISEEIKQEMLKLKEEGMSLKDLADRFNLTAGTISGTLHRERNKKVCEYCGKKFTTKRKHARFCSDECRNKWWKNHPEQVNKKAFYTLTCKCCGKTFIAYGDKHRKYCSIACYREDRFKK